MGLKFLNPMKGFLFVNISNLIIKNPSFKCFTICTIYSLYFCLYFCIIALIATFDRCASLRSSSNSSGLSQYEELFCFSFGETCEAVGDAELFELFISYSFFC